MRIKTCLAVVLPLALALTGCGSGDSQPAAQPAQPITQPITSCPSWPELFNPTLGQSGSAVLQVVVKDRCTMWVAGYSGSSRSAQIEGDSTGFLLQLRLDNQGVVQTDWTYRLQTNGTDSIDMLQRDGDDIVFVGRTNGSLAGSQNSGKEDLVMGRLSARGELKSIGQLGTIRPDRATGMHKIAADKWMLLGYTDVYIPTNFVDAWEDSLQLSVIERNQKFELQNVYLSQTSVPDRTLYSVASSLQADTYWIARHIEFGRDQGLWLEQVNSTGQLLRKTRLSTLGLDTVSGLFLQGQQLVVTGSTFLKLGAQQFGQSDLFIARLDANSGDLQTIQQFGSANDDWSTSADLSQDELLIVGDNYQDLDLDTVPFVFRLTNSNNRLELLKNQGFYSTYSVAKLPGKVVVAGQVRNNNIGNSFVMVY